MNIQLTKEMETLLIPLYGRAKMSIKGVFKDEDAEFAVKNIDYDFSKLQIRDKTQVMLSLRGALIDEFTIEFIREHPDSTAIYLGCGLDARAKRLGYPAKIWYDLDFPQVIDIKKQLYSETDNYRFIPSSVTDWDWMDGIASSGKPALIIAEGLLMYLRGQDVKTLFLKLRDKFGEVIIIFDAYSKLTAKQAKSHPSLKKTGAAIKWGIDSPKEAEAFGEGINYKKTLYFTDQSATKYLPGNYRLMFKIAGKFKAAREAHRIFVMELNSNIR